MPFFCLGTVAGLYLSLYLGCCEEEVGAFCLVILLGQVVGAADSLDALSSGGGHMSVAAGFVLLDTAAVVVVMGRCLVILTPHTASTTSTVVLPPSTRLLLTLTMLLLRMMPNWLQPLVLLVFDTE